MELRENLLLEALKLCLLLPLVLGLCLHCSEQLVELGLQLTSSRFISLLSPPREELQLLHRHDPLAFELILDAQLYQPLQILEVVLCLSKHRCCRSSLSDHQR
jgi:hypothetical protein